MVRPKSQADPPWTMLAHSSRLHFIIIYTINIILIRHSGVLKVLFIFHLRITSEVVQAGGPGRVQLVVILLGNHNPMPQIPTWDSFNNMSHCQIYSLGCAKLAVFESAFE